jgi:DNA-binding NarL/FixJ family response regulator
MHSIPWWERLGIPREIAEKGGEEGERHVFVVLSHNAFLRRVVADFLSAGGALVQTRSSMEDALARPLKEIDLLVCDYSLPQGDGLHLLKEIRVGRTGFPMDVPFVLMAEAAERWLVQAAIGLDADGCLLLPLNAHKVDEAVRIALKRQRVLAQVDDYEEVATEPPAPAKPAVPAAVAAPALPACFARAVEGANMVPVAELRPAMVLGADLVSERGLVLLNAGARLEPGVVRRLRDAASSFGFDSVPIAPEGERP